MWSQFKDILGIKTGPTLYEKVFFRVSHPLAPTLLFLPLAFILIFWARASQGFSWTSSIALVAVGLLLWTLIEYVLHRFVFHWTSVREPWRTFFSGLHMAHHREPDDPSLIIAPPMVSFPDSLVIFGLLLLLTWNWGVAASILAGVQIGYVYYEWVHYGSHEFQPRSSLGKYLKRYHLAHHFKHPKEVFGVTVPLWDWVFRTNR